MDLVSGMLGALLTSWTIRAALVCYAVYVALGLATNTALTANKPNLARAIWTAGCMLFVVHVACAFHFYHHWSHQAAWQKTAEETQSILGFAFGNGIYFSYLFLVLWVTDVVWLWTIGRRSLRSPETIGSPHSRSARSATAVPLAAGGCRTPKWRLAVHGFLLFIAVNGAIIFEGGVTRVAGVPVVLALTGLAVWRASKPSRLVRELPPRERIHKDTDRDYITTASG